jgi:diguanylate cyclase (GGDEF)-like protein
MNFSSHSPVTLQKSLLLLLGALCVGGLGVIDYYMEPRFSFLIFYLFPICFVTWYAGRYCGVVISVVSTAAWIFADFLPMKKYEQPVISYWNMLSTFIVFLAISLMLSKLKQTLRIANDLARTDPVTDLPNRRAFSEFAGIELYRTNRYKRPFTIAYLDFDNLKQISEIHGIDTEDGCLRALAHVLSANVRSSDFLATLDRDVFAILLTETNEDQSKAVIEKLIGSLQELLGQEKWDITFSIGVVTYIRPPSTVAEMLKKADHMAHTAKREGRNRAHYLVWRESAIVR